MAASRELGGLLGAETLVDPSVLACDRIVFAAGTGPRRWVRTANAFGSDRTPFVPLVAGRSAIQIDD